MAMFSGTQRSSKKVNEVLIGEWPSAVCDTGHRLLAKTQWEWKCNGSSGNGSDDH